MARVFACLLCVLSVMAVLPVRAGPSATEIADDEKILKLAKLASDGQGLLGYFRAATPTEAARQKLVERIQQLGSNTFVVREKASEALVATGPAALKPLRQALSDTDAEIRLRAKDSIDAIEKKHSASLSAAGARLLRARAPAGSVEALLAYLPFADDETVEREVFQTVLELGYRDGKLDPHLAAGLTEKEPLRRAAAAVMVGRYGSADQQATVRSLLADADPLVRFRAAQGLLAARDKNAVPTLLALLSDAPLAIAEQAEDVLGCLAGARSPAAALGSEALSRRKCREAWETWWRTNKQSFDLNNADIDLLLRDPSTRAREVAVQFLTAMTRGDAALLKRTTDVPFSLMGMAQMNTREEFERVFNEQLAAMKQRKMTFVVRNLLSTEEYLKTASASERDYLTKVRGSGLRLIQVQINDNQRVETSIIMVQINGSRARVIGIGEGKSAKSGK